LDSSVERESCRWWWFWPLKRSNFMQWFYMIRRVQISFFLPSKCLKKHIWTREYLGFGLMLGFFGSHMMTISYYYFFLKWLRWMSSSPINSKKKIKTCVRLLLDRPCAKLSLASSATHLAKFFSFKI
jgi:hypothetical protein